MNLSSYKVLYFIIFVTLLGSVSQAQQPQISWSERPFSDGEKLVYCVYYNWKFVWIPAGEVTFNIKEKDNKIIFHVTGVSYASYDSFFKVRDDYVSEVDKKSFLPTVFRRDILEGSYQRFDSIAFDQQTFTLKEYFGKTKAGAKEHKFDVKKPVQDMISAIYSLRSNDLSEFKKGDNIPISIFFDKELFDVNIKYFGTKEKKVKGYGLIDALHLQPELIDGYVFKQGDLMDIWVSNDANKIPILIESPVSLGSIKAVLISVSGAKHQLGFLLP